jgi:glucose/arabinose dehydrogenase
LRVLSHARAGATGVAIIIAAVLIVGCGSGASNVTVTPSAATVVAATTTAAGSVAPATTIHYALVPVRVPSANAGFGARRVMTLPRGWTAELWALVPGARLETWTPQGDLLVSAPSDGRITELIPRSDRGRPPAQRTLVANLTLPQGMAFDALHGREVLYVAEGDALDRYQWNDGRLGPRTVVAADLPDAGPAGADVHTLKNVTVGPDHTAYIDIGSASNASPPSGSGSIPRASVLAFAPGSRHPRVFATGVRNGDGLSFAPDGTLWTAVNERDQISYPFHRAYGTTADAYGKVIQAYVNDHPPDEVARLTAGRDLGWPYCDPDPDTQPGVAGTAMSYGNLRFTPDQQTNPTGARLNCHALAPLQRGIPAHSAPLGFHFLERSRLPAPWNAGAVVATHGSWDREPPRPPEILWLPWEARAHTLGPAVSLVGGFQDAGGNRWGRTVDAVAGPDGALYVSDDQAGAIYRIVPTAGF